MTMIELETELKKVETITDANYFATVISHYDTIDSKTFYSVMWLESGMKTLGFISYTEAINTVRSIYVNNLIRK